MVSALDELLAETGSDNAGYRAVEQLYLMLFLDRSEWWPVSDATAAMPVSRIAERQRMLRHKRNLAMAIKGRMPLPWQFESIVRSADVAFYLKVMTRLAATAEYPAAGFNPSLATACPWLRSWLYGPIVSTPPEVTPPAVQALAERNRQQMAGLPSSLVEATYQLAVASALPVDASVSVSQSVLDDLAEREAATRSVLRAAPKPPQQSPVAYLQSERDRRGLARVWQLPGLARLRPQAPTQGRDDTYNFNENLAALGDEEMLLVAQAQQKLGTLGAGGSMFRGNDVLPGVDTLVNANCPRVAGCWNDSLVGWDSHYTAASRYLSIGYPDYRIWDALYAAAAEQEFVLQQAKDAQQHVTDTLIEEVEQQTSLQAVLQQQAVPGPDGYEGTAAEYLAGEALRRRLAPWELPGLQHLKPPQEFDWGQDLIHLGEHDPQLFFQLLEELSRIGEAALQLPWKLRDETKFISPALTEVWSRIPRGFRARSIVRWAYGNNPEQRGPLPINMAAALSRYYPAAAVAQGVRELRPLRDAGMISRASYEQELRQLRDQAQEEIAAAVNAELHAHVDSTLETTRESMERHLEALSDTPIGALARQAEQLGLTDTEGQGDEACSSILGVRNPLCVYSKPLSIAGGVAAFAAAGWLSRFVPDAGIRSLRLLKLLAAVGAGGAAYYFTRRYTKSERTATDEVTKVAKATALVGAGVVGGTTLLHLHKIRQEMANVREFMEAHAAPEGERKKPQPWPDGNAVAGRLGTSIGRLAGVLWFPETWGNWSDDNYIDRARQMVEEVARKYGRSLNDLPAAAQDQMEAKAHDMMVQVRQSRDEMSFFERLVTA